MAVNFKGWANTIIPSQIHLFSLFLLSKTEYCCFKYFWKSEAASTSVAFMINLSDLLKHNDDSIKFKIIYVEILDISTIF